MNKELSNKLRKKQGPQMSSKIELNNSENTSLINL